MCLQQYYYYFQVNVMNAQYLFFLSFLFANLIAFGSTAGVSLGWAIAPSAPFGPTVFDTANAVAVAEDGSIILAGAHVTDGSNISRFAALQLIPEGTGIRIGWTTSLSEPFGAGFGEEAASIIIAPDKSIILVGLYEPLDASPRFAALQLVPNADNTNVTLGWATAPIDPFGTSNGAGDRANAVALAADGSIIVVGLHDPTGAPPIQFAALQLVPNADNTAVTLGWTTAPIAPFGPVGGVGDQANDIVILDNGSIILAGFHVLPSGSSSRFSALQLKPNDHNTDVALGWATAILSPFGLIGLDQARAVAVVSDGSIILGGFHDIAGPNERFASLQLIPNTDNTNVSLGWATALIDPFGFSGIDEARAMAIADDGSILLGGFAVNNGLRRFAALQLKPNDSNTNVTLGWATAPVAPFGASIFDRSNGIAIASDGSIILAGLHSPLGEPSRFAALQLILDRPVPEIDTFVSALIEKYSPFCQES